MAHQVKKIGGTSKGANKSPVKGRSPFRKTTGAQVPSKKMQGPVEQGKVVAMERRLKGKAF